MHLARLTIEPLHKGLAGTLLRQRFIVVTKAQQAGFEGGCWAYGRERQQAHFARMAIAVKERHETTLRPHMLATHAALRVGDEPRRPCTYLQHLTLHPHRPPCALPPTLC